jgi:hypothetical protein
MSTPEEIAEIKRFTIVIFTYEAACAMARTEEIASELIVLAASYGPPRNITTEHKNF